MLVTLTPAAALGVLVVVAFAALYANDGLRWPTFTARPVIDPPPPAPRPTRSLPLRETGLVVIPGRHRLENALDADAAPYRPVMWSVEPRQLVGALEPITARPYTLGAVIELEPEERPTVELTPVG